MCCQPMFAEISYPWISSRSVDRDAGVLPVPSRDFEVLNQLLSIQFCLFCTRAILDRTVPFECPGSWTPNSIENSSVLNDRTVQYPKLPQNEDLILF